MGATIRIGVLVSGGGSNLQAIIDACDSGLVPGRVVFVGSDRPGAGGLERAAGRGIPTFVVDYGAVSRRVAGGDGGVPPPAADVEAAAAASGLFPPGTPVETVRAFMIPRIAAETVLLEKMRHHPFDLLVLAGFMRTLTPYLIDRVNPAPDRPRIMNIHPALLPSFPGTDGYGETFRYGCKVGGCTVHFVDYGEDTGPIIGQKAFEITPNDTLETVREKGLALEWALYPECIRLFAQGRLNVVHRIHRSGKGGDVRRTVVEIR